MKQDIEEMIKRKLGPEISTVIDSYDFSDAVDEVLNTMELHATIEDAVFNYMIDNADDLVGDAVNDIIEEEVPEYVDELFEN